MIHRGSSDCPPKDCELNMLIYNKQLGAVCKRCLFLLIWGAKVDKMLSCASNSPKLYQMSDILSIEKRIEARVKEESDV